jgi:autotransporter-associated beta strand protein
MTLFTWQAVGPPNSSWREVLDMLRKLEIGLGLVLAAWLGPSLANTARAAVVNYWIGPNGGLFNAGANWSPTGVPNAVDAAVWFADNKTNPPMTVNMTGELTLGSITFRSLRGYSILAGAGTPPPQIRLQTSGGSARIDALLGAHTISAPLWLASDTVAATPASPLSLLGPIGGIGGLTKSGPGTLVLAGPNTYTGGTFANAGTLWVSNAGGLPLHGNLTIQAGAQVVLQPGLTGSGVRTTGAVVNEVPEPSTLVLFTCAFLVLSAMHPSVRRRLLARR